MKGILIIIAIVAIFCSQVEARPGYWIMKQNGAILNTSTGWAGAVLAYSTSSNGINSHHLTIFGINTINTTITNVTLNSALGVVATLKWNNTQSKYNQYIYGRVTLNHTSYTALTQDALAVVVYTSKYPQGAISGYFYQRAYSFVAALTPDGIVGTTPTDTDTGLAIVDIYSKTADPIGVDLIQYNNDFLGNLTMSAFVISNVKASTGAAVAGPAYLNTTASPYAVLTPYNYYYYGVFPNASAILNSNLAALLYGYSYVQINSTAWPLGDIRGQLYPTVGNRRREVPSLFTQGTNGNLVGYLSSCFRATQYGTNNNPNSYIQLIPTPATSTFTGYFRFQMPVSTSNLQNIRYLTLNMNAKSAGGALWNFYAYNYATSTYVLFGTFSSEFWYQVFYNVYDYNVQYYVNDLGYVTMKVESTAATGPLYLDQFTVRPWVPSTNANAQVRSYMKDLSVTFGF